MNNVNIPEINWEDISNLGSQIVRDLSQRVEGVFGKTVALERVEEMNRSISRLQLSHSDISKQNY